MTLILVLISIAALAMLTGAGMLACRPSHRPPTRDLGAPGIWRGRYVYACGIRADS